MIKIGDLIIIGSFHSNASGSAYLMNDDLAKDVYIHRNNTNRALHLDTVKVKIVKGDGRELEGTVLEVVKRFKTEFVGTIEISPSYAFFIPDSNKMPVDMYIPIGSLLGATNGQKVIAKLTGWRANSKSPNGEIIKVLGDAGDNDTEIHSILHEYDLPYDFKEDVIAESEAIPSEIKQSDIDARRDMRGVTTFTIDPETAKDFDDALSVQWIDGIIEVGVHIADVSHYLRPDTDLDKEAYRRGTSVYLVDRVVPMLPERLSNGLCSLRPNEDKLCFSAIFTLDRQGKILTEWFGRTIINSDKRYSYEEAQVIIESPFTAVQGDKLFNSIKELDGLAKKLRAKRLSTGSITFDKQEVKFKLDENNKPIDIIFKHAKDANKLIEEFMLLANRRVAYLLNHNKYPSVNRVHEEPLREKLMALNAFIKQFGYSIKFTNVAEIVKSLNKLLEDVEDKPEGNLISNLVVRTMQKAYYSTKNLGHYGLGFDDYVHFTSPIRRYPDVMIHRLLGRYLENKPMPKVEKLESKCNYLSEKEKRAQKAERDSIKYMQAVYMSERVGKIFKGIITSVTDYGLFITVVENGCDCLVKINNISGNWVSYVDQYQIREINTGEVIKLADEVQIIISSVDIEKKNIDATLIRF
jgi:ribonuclease R/exosome complex exonuclease DIS3/RRP44